MSLRGRMEDDENVSPPPGGEDVALSLRILWHNEEPWAAATAQGLLLTHSTDNTMDKEKHTKKYVRLTFDERIQIERLLRGGESLLGIARVLHRHPSSIQREIVRYATPSEKGAKGRSGRNRCLNRHKCTKRKSLCSPCDYARNWQCRACNRCNSVCPEFVEEHCLKLKQAPFVCNGCVDGPKCSLSKMFYLAGPANDMAQIMRKESRQGINATEDELRTLERLLYPGLLMGQSINHILAAHADELSMCQKTVYRYIAARLISIRNGDLPRKPRLKPRKQNPNLSHKVDRKCRIGRTIEDYRAFYENEGPFPRVLMDTVIGKPGGKVLLTIHFCESNFMLARLLPNKTSLSVIEAFDDLTLTLGLSRFQDLFPAILTDNGNEFSNPIRLEHFLDGALRTRIFYCDIYNSNQKAEIERNHEFLRLVLTKGSSFDNLTQAKIDLLLSHVNSYMRPKFGNKTPIDLFTYRYSTEILDTLNQTLIPPDDICLKPNLLIYS